MIKSTKKSSHHFLFFIVCYLIQGGKYFPLEITEGSYTSVSIAFYGEDGFYTRRTSSDRGLGGLLSPSSPQAPVGAALQGKIIGSKNAKNRKAAHLGRLGL